jgi:hypothetical protein
MLWRRPARAQPPIVVGRKWTFAARRISAASPNEIQSEAAIGQSPDFAVDVPGALLAVVEDVGSPAGLASPVEEAAPSESSEPPLPVLLDPAAAERRSFLAQPVPLKWIVGAAIALRMVPSAPHDGQNVGPESLTPWRMSVRWLHALQTYS